jgi:phage FluMu protein Com
VPDLRKRSPYGQKKGTCRSCGKVVWKGRGSVAEPMCQPCRRVSPQRAPKGSIPTSRRPRPTEPRGSAHRRGYGRDHQVERLIALENFTPGDRCPRCKTAMLAEDPLDLDHTDQRDGYLGLAHSWCNRSHKPEGTTRPEQRRRPCLMCGAVFRARLDTQRCCSRTCATARRALA